MGNLFLVIKLGRHVGAHGEPTQKTNDHAINAGVVYLKKPSQNRLQDSDKRTGQVHADNNTGKDHKWKKSRDHFPEPKVQPVQGKGKAVSRKKKDDCGQPESQKCINQTLPPFAGQLIDIKFQFHDRLFSTFVL